MEKLIPNAVEIHQIIKTFRPASSAVPLRKPAPVLKGLSLSLKAGEILGLMGPNGSGKTTLLKILCGLVMPDRGDIRIFGGTMPEDLARVKPWISFVTGDDRSFYPRLTGRQNLRFFAALYGLSKKTAEKRMRSVFQFLHIQDPDQRYQEYSAGIKQRLSIARGLLPDARLLLLDEPTRYLDIQERQNFLALIRRLRDSENPVSMIWATHEAEEIAGLADRIAILSEGSIQACGTLAELRMKSEEKATLSEIYLEQVKAVIARETSWSGHSRQSGNPGNGSPIKAFGDDTPCQIASPAGSRNDKAIGES